MKELLLFVDVVVKTLNLQISRCRLEGHGRVFTTAVVSLNIPESGLFADFVKQLKNDTCFHG